MAGLTPTGFTKRTVEDMLAQVAADHQANISTSLDTSSSSPAGQWDGSYIKIASELWDLAQAINSAMDPDKNEGDGQDAIGAITGCRRLAATHSQARSVILGLNIGTTITTTALAAVQGNPAARFRFVGMEPVVFGDPVVVGDFTAPATGAYIARFEAVDTGPVAAPAGTLTVIVTPITGWTLVDTSEDAVLGRNVETAAQMRSRRERELSSLGTTTLDAIQAEFDEFLDEQENPGVAIVYQNEDDVADADGRPPHSIEIIIDDGLLLANNLIAQQVLDSKTYGIKSFGATTGTAHDSRGLAHTMNFNRPTDQLIYFAVTVFTDPDKFPLDGAAQIKAAMVARGQAGANLVRREPGEDVIWGQFFSPCFTVPGVLDVTVLHVGTAPAPTLSVNIPITVRQMARFDVARVAVTVT